MKRVTLFCGHYGSGKTNIAVNYALKLKADGLDVALADLDIVNPYFRSKDSTAELEKAGVRVIALPFANSSVDLPALPSQAYSLVQNRSVYAVLDIGGDDRGAYALGRFVPYILEENDYDMFFVVNYCRPLTLTPEKALEVLREIEEACRTASIHDFIMTLDKGYDTLVGDFGVELSVGQKQRINIARAICANPAILIMDEATSSLDSDSEQAIQKAMDRVLIGRTSFVVAHRLSTIKNSDQIILLDKGVIQEQGTHDQLMAIPNGRYHDLYTKHMGKGVIEE